MNDKVTWKLRQTEAATTQEIYRIIIFKSMSITNAFLCTKYKWSFISNLMITMRGYDT